METENKIQKNFRKNLIYACVAQGISFCFSFLMSLLVPKLLGVEQYAYWQLFIFYSSYVGFFHLGLSDGIYLKCGGIEAANLDRAEIVSQFRLMIGWQICICMIGLLFIIPSTLAYERKMVWIFVALYLILANATWFWGYVFQAANQTRVYSISTIISKSAFIIVVLVMFVIKPTSYLPFVASYVVVQGIALLYVLYKSNDFQKTKSLRFTDAVRVTWDNIKIGINLTISNIVSSLILGVGRAMVDKSAGIGSFGMLSLAVSLTNFFLQFITAVSMVMFPALRQITEQTMKKIFVKLRSGISYFLCLILLLYVPLKMFLSWWLPQYTESLTYMAFLLPICVFDGKMQLLFNTYLKVLRKERTMLLINLTALAISAGFCAIGAFVISDIVAVAIAMTSAIVVRSLLANIYLSKELGVSVDKNIFWEIGLALLFIVVNAYTNNVIAFVTYGCVYVVYLLLNRREIKELTDIALKKLGRGKKHGIMQESEI
ncbi:MAG: oligosaccharide flippase family protein [Agathobacter sp.]